MTYYSLIGVLERLVPELVQVYVETHREGSRLPNEETARAWLHGAFEDKFLEELAWQLERGEERTED